MARRNKPSAAVGNKKPERSWVAIVQTALKAQTLAVTHAAALGDRLSSAFLAQFASDLDSLQNAISTALATQNGVMQNTAAQNATLLRARNLLAGVRKAVRGQTSDPDVLRAYGVGVKTFLLVKNIKAVLQTILSRVASEPAEAAGFGIGSDDVAALNTALGAIELADNTQEAARAAAPAVTLARNAIARRILAGITRIQGAGMRAFADDPATRALFVDIG